MLDALAMEGRFIRQDHQREVRARYNLAKARILTLNRAHDREIEAGAKASEEENSQKLRNCMAAEAAFVHSTINKINSLEDAKAPGPRSSDFPPINDLLECFKRRKFYPELIRRRIEYSNAKVHWKLNGKAGFFNKAVHRHRIPVDQMLCILSNFQRFDQDGVVDVDGRVEAVIECGLFPARKIGSRFYKRYCQDLDHCHLCNYRANTGGLREFFQAYDSTMFNRAGTSFAITIAPSTSKSTAQSRYGTIAEPDWDSANEQSLVYGHSTSGRVFAYTDQFGEEGNDLAVSRKIRRFLTGCRDTLKNAVKAGLLDGVRAKVENSVEFMPFKSHQHVHAVGSSLCESDPRPLAEYLRTELDSKLRETCPGVFADVTVVIIPTPEDLRCWIQYMQKTVDLPGAVGSAYDRHPKLYSDRRTVNTLMEQLWNYFIRSSLVFSRFSDESCADEIPGGTPRLFRTYAYGNHKFGKGSILTESERHTRWRESHAKSSAERREKAFSQKKKNLLCLLDQRTDQPWPQCGISLDDVLNRGVLGDKKKSLQILRKLVKLKVLRQDDAIQNNGSNMVVFSKYTRENRKRKSNSNPASRRTQETVQEIAAGQEFRYTLEPVEPEKRVCAGISQNG
jgi:hypothetical protein